MKAFYEEQRLQPQTAANNQQLHSGGIIGVVEVDDSKFFSQPVSKYHHQPKDAASLSNNNYFINSNNVNNTCDLSSSVVAGRHHHSLSCQSANYSEEMPGSIDVAERDLAEDAQWKRIQQNTFTRWANEHLKIVDQRAENLETDLSDGLQLIRLIEVLSHKKLPRHNKRPTFRSQKLENVSVALNFLQGQEGIRIVNIDSSDIVDQNLKLILGLIWTLILHYSISMPVWEDEVSVENGNVKETPKQRLMGWIHGKIPEFGVCNFTSDWRDGRALGALVDAVAPGLNSDWPKWKADDALPNTAYAMNLADDWLGVAKLVEPEEMVNPNVDELSIMTYLSQYPNAKLKPGAPIGGERVEKSTLLDKHAVPPPSPPPPPPPPLVIRAYGSGLESGGVKVGEETEFHVEASDGSRGAVNVAIRTAAGCREPVRTGFDDVRCRHVIKYTPSEHGPHSVNVELDGTAVDGSPFTVLVDPKPVDVSKVKATGPGLEPGVTIGKSTFFEIFPNGAGDGRPDVVILDPSGSQNRVRPAVKPAVNEAFRCDYVAQETGTHSINILYDGRHIPGSPFGVHVAHGRPPTTSCKINIVAVDSRKVRAWGRGLQSSGVRVGDKADFKVFTEGAGEKRLEIRAVGPRNELLSVDQKKIDESTYSCVYHPAQPGKHSLKIKFGNQDVSKSPFEVDVGRKIDSNIRAFGPGLEGGMANLPCDFTVETNEETGALGFSIEGPSQAKISCTDNQDGSAEISYLPTVAGLYAVHILCNDEDIPNSPYMVDIETYDDRVKDNGDQTYTCGYVPTKAMKHTILISYGGVAVAGSPYRVYVQEPVDASRVRVYGPGVEQEVKSQQQTHFFVDCKQAGPGEVEVGLTNDKGANVDIDTLDNKDGSFTIKYTAPRPDRYLLRVVFAGTEIPGSPFSLNVQPHLDLGGIRVEGINSRIFVDSPTEFTVDAKKVSRLGGGKVVCDVRGPENVEVNSVVTDNFDGTYSVAYTPFHEGPYHIELLYDSIPVSESPITVFAQKGFDAGRCKAHGVGLERGLVNLPCQFIVETKGAGQGGLGLSIEGPMEAQMSCKDNKDGSCSVEYLPKEPGQYIISVRYADQHIPGSPFSAIIDYPVDAGKVEAWGPGLEPENCRANVPLSFHVDASKCGYAPLNVDVKSDRGPAVRLPEIREREGNQYDVIYHSPPEGSWCTLHVTYGGADIPKSPYRLHVLPQVEPQKVKICGEEIVPLGEVPASIPVTFNVDTTQAGYANLEVLVMDPSQTPCPVEVLDREDGTYEVTFVPEDVGPYNIVVKYGGEQIARTPYRIKACPIGDASKCWFMEHPKETVVINEEYCITVNASEAGKGNVTCRVLPNHSGAVPLDIDIENNKDGTFSVYYTLKQPEQYQFCVKFGGRVIPKGEYMVSAEPRGVETLVNQTQSVTEAGEEPLPPVEFWNIPLPQDLPAKYLTGEVIMPSKKTDVPVIKENADGSVTVKYQPHERGLHEMHIKYNGAHVQGSPFQFHVDSLKEGYVTAYGAGLVYGVAGEPAYFTVSARDSGAGGLSVSVEGPAKADIKCHDNKDGTCSVTWTPPVAGEYKIYIRFADKNISGSPFLAKVTGEGRKRAQLSVGSTSEVSLKISEPDITVLSGSIKSPSGIEEPCFIRKLDESHLGGSVNGSKKKGISFTPREIGEHLVAVKKKGTLIPNAPFRIHVGEKEVGNADKVKVAGSGLEKAQTQQFNDFTVDTRNAGFGGLSVCLEGPSKSEIQCRDNKDGTCKIMYKPTEPGVYVLNLKFADHHVPGSPYTISCQGAGVGTVSEAVSKKRNQATQVAAGQECELCLRMPNTNPMDLQAKLLTPGGKTEDVVLADLSDSQYIIRFTPNETGLHTISVLHKGQHVSGSPFQFTVGPFNEGGAHKVRAGGPGLMRGEVNVPSSFNIYTREAGAGNLSLAIEGPSKAKIDFKDHKDGNCYVVYTVSKHGEYVVSIKFDDRHIPDSPFKVLVAAGTGEARKLALAAFPDRGLQLDKPVTFTVLTQQAKGHLDARVVAPSGTQDDCFITPIDEGESCAVRFIPKEMGVHYVHITLDGTHMPDSPFSIKVGGNEESDPTAITVVGPGIKTGRTGQKCEFLLNTCDAGEGILQVNVDGPSKVTLDAYEVDGGYKVCYTPMAPGDYFTTIKHNGVHIPGSPFKVNIEGKMLGGSGFNESSMVTIRTIEKTGKGISMESVPRFQGDPTKVECTGTGLKKVNLGRQNTFTVDCSKAGADILFVSVVTPTGPSDEVYIKHAGRGVYNVNYLVRERGQIFIYVKYGDRNIPGSPFSILI